MTLYQKFVGYRFIRIKKYTDTGVGWFDMINTD